MGGIPAPYDLDFGPYLGVPFYHFMSNWETAVGKINFTKMGGGQAKVGHKVEAWSNTFLSPGEGDAVVPLDYIDTCSVPPTNMNYFGEDGYPTLVETDYGGKKLKGLEFTGTQYFQINGSTVTNMYTPPGPIFSTGGASWAGNTGATFMFVIDSSDDILGYSAPGMSEYGGGASPIQSLIYSRQPVYNPGFGTQAVPIATWPNTEDLGIQYLRNVQGNPGQIVGTTPRGGPQGVHQGVPSAPAPNALTRSPAGGYGGAELWNNPNDLEGLAFDSAFTGASWANPGLQVILLEYDNVNWAKHQDIPNFGVDRPYEGPILKVYGMSNPAYGTYPWNGLDLTTPKLTWTNPMLRDQTLFDKANLLLGGVPAIQLEYQFTNSGPGNGFRGIIYEVMMLEGILSTSDKQRLQKILERKYPI